MLFTTQDFARIPASLQHSCATPSLNESLAVAGELLSVQTVFADLDSLSTNLSRLVDYSVARPVAVLYV